eukprot:TRINITY_DN48751_c0_g1_i1.p1 TRINITY_DN48751_c0_g1~~TRINITY_DN48751_c0_g1_i1.p1  ORF type:complete len:693 (+),score=93.31 TRINITY_DN48751_c0_g1_i1:95-2080(+)
MHPESDDDMKHPGGHEYPDSDEERAGHIGHHCTDIPCLIMWWVALVPFVLIVRYSFENGNLAKVSHGYDFLGRLCGVDEHATNVTDASSALQQSKVLGGVLYWCPKPIQIPLTNTTALDLEHPICLDRCPTKEDVDKLVKTSCYQTHTTVPIGSSNADGTFTTQTTYVFDMVPAYESHAFAGRYCYPKDTALATAMKEALQSSWTTRWIVSLSGVWSAKWVLLISAILAFFLGYAYLCCVNWCSRPIVYICMAVLIIGPLIGGIYLLVITFTGHESFDGVPSTGDKQWDMIIGFSLLVLSVVFLVVSCCAHSAIEMAIACMQAACECIFDLPTILVQPALALAIYSFYVVVMFGGLFYLISCGEVKQTSLQEYVAAYDVGSANVVGVARSFTFSQDQLQMIAYYVFMILWVTEICNAFSQFVLAYTVQLWYFTPYIDDDKQTPYCPLCRAYRIGLLFHMGTLTFGAFLIAILRFVRLVLAQLAKQANASGNKAAACAAKSCMCLVTCFETCVKFINKNAYMDVAIRSSDFCTAAKRAMRMIAENLATIAVLNGATWVFFIGGLGAITAAGSWLTFLLVTRLPQFSTPDEPLFVSDPILVTIFAGIISATVAWAFMIVFDTVADTVLFCYATEMKRRQQGTIDPGFHYAPPTLHDIIQEDMR